MEGYMSFTLRRFLQRIFVIIVFFGFTGTAIGGETENINIDEAKNSELAEKPCDEVRQDTVIQRETGGGRPDSYCYDWNGYALPCDFRGAMGEYLLNEKSPEPRFRDLREDGIADLLTGLIWYKNPQSFGQSNWHEARVRIGQLNKEQAASTRAEGWRLPTLMEMGSLVDFSRRNPALPQGHPFTDIPIGYFWTSTPAAWADHLAHVVYMDVGVVCYNAVTDKAGFVWPVRGCFRYRKAPPN